MNALEIPVIGMRGNYFGRLGGRKNFGGITLAETYYTSDTFVPEHRHEFPGFFFASKGVFETTTAGGKIRFWGGQVSCHAPDDLHSTRVLSPGACGLNIELGDTCVNTPEVFRIRTAPRGSKIPILLVQLYAELRARDAASTLAVQGLVLQAIAELTREEERHVLQRPQWMSRAEQFLSDNTCDGIDMKQLSAVAGIGSRQLLRAFKQFLNCTPGQYVRKRRIEIARQHLAETREPVARVAMEAGFYDQAHFCHEFKKANGCSPREYRELLGSREVHGEGERESIAFSDEF